MRGSLSSGLKRLGFGEFINKSGRKFTLPLELMSKGLMGLKYASAGGLGPLAPL